MALMAVVAFVVLFAGTVSAGEFDGWSQGRATYYGEDGGTTIHQGSCMMSIQAGQGTGLDITALSDSAPDYKGSCGRCYEVACRPTQVRDGYGGTLDRTHSCQGQKSVIVTVTDTCPCHYPSNAYSNKRWCCGDQYHMDLSKYAYEKIGNLGHGVMGIYYRPNHTKVLFFVCISTNVL
ncbi:RlpA-like double-psi beta-barrel-protein domain-containing protein-containing protein [Scenedesmus sp. NREL 46B-D3]|nr:RlpA-like double-psi beta-barrel-protein domain-containing protein-containing protein [Scenedesmus sp. NREL 46B-D3]